MKFYDEQLRQLQEQLSRKRQLEAMAAELRCQHSDLSARVQTLEIILQEEQQDVQRLEGRSLAAFYYNVIGKMDEQLTREREEAYAAQVKYDAAALELAGVEEDLKRCEAELATLQGCEAKYAALLREKAAGIKTAGGADAEKILQMEERLAFLTSQKKELEEAISAGEAACLTTARILANLGSAEGWGTWDLLGGGLISDIAKHGHLDEAQANVEHLQSQLRRFKTELADVQINADMQVNIDGFLRFADYFFDGLFADWAVLDRIHHAQDRVLSTQRAVASVLSRLESMLSSVQQEGSRLHSELETFVRNYQ